MLKMKSAFLAILLGLAVGVAHGEDFTKLEKPQPVAVPGKIEVIEFFWYGCPHCNDLEPAVEAWEGSLAKDVAFRREHVIWSGRGATEAHARIFLTLRSMNLLKQHHRAVFEAIHKTKSELRSEKEVFDWAAKRGIDRAKFEATYKSFGINAQVARAKDLTERYLVEGVPGFAVNGKYMTTLGMTRSDKRMFEVVNKLIADERGKK
jgi:thiol:disulfide interchange protein DsbA